jgi:NADPH2:quinone reductase
VTKAIRVHQFGGPEVLQYEAVSLPPPGAGEIRLKHEAIGLNFIDVYHRTGLYPNQTPFVPGSEAAGTVTAIGADVSDIQAGDRVTYHGPMGAYCQERNMPAAKALPLPADISFETAAAITLKGMTVCYLLTMTWPLKAGDTLLLHAAAGGVGSLAVQWAKHLGARVIGTVGSEEKAALARAHGADEVINLQQEDFVARVHALTGGRGVDVVYDSIGKATFERSLDCLRPRGLMVSFGNASGPVTVENLGVLAAKGSLYLTRPTLAHYFGDRETALEGAARLFELVRKGVLTVNIGQRFKLSEVAESHRALEGRRTVGSTILLP